MDLRHVDLIADPVIIRVDHRIISSRLHLLTECVDNIRDLCRSQAVHFLRFHIEDHRVGDWIIFDEIQDKIRIRFRHRCSRRVGIKVNTDAESRRRCPAHIRIKIRIHRIVVPRSDHRELDIISGDRGPVDILLPLGNIDTPGQDTGKHGTITSNIGAGRVLLPGSRPYRNRRTYRGKSHDGT